MPLDAIVMNVVICSSMVHWIHEHCTSWAEWLLVWLLQGGSGAPALQKALRPTTHRLSAADARLLEESLRFGVTRLFSADLDTVQRSDAEGAIAFVSAQPTFSSGKGMHDATQEDRVRSTVSGRTDAKVEEPDSRNGKATELHHVQGDSEMNDDACGHKDGVH